MSAERFSQIAQNETLPAKTIGLVILFSSALLSSKLIRINLLIVPYQFAMLLSVSWREHWAAIGGKEAAGKREIADQLFCEGACGALAFCSP